jgi:hypothetical protein
MGISATRLMLMNNNETGASLGRALGEAPRTLRVTCVILNVDPAAPSAPAVPSGAVRVAGGGSALAAARALMRVMCLVVWVWGYDRRLPRHFWRLRRRTRRSLLALVSYKWEQGPLLEFQSRRQFAHMRRRRRARAAQAPAAVDGAR